MKKYILIAIPVIGLLIVISWFSAFFLVPDALLISVATYEKKQDEINQLVLIFPPSLIDIKFSSMGFKSCDLELFTDGDETELVSFLVSAYSHDDNIKERILKYLEIAIVQGCDINKAETLSGLSPLHAAVLYNEPKLVSFLLKNGADITETSESSNLRFNGMIALEFAKNLELIDKKDRSEIILLLKN